MNGGRNSDTNDFPNGGAMMGQYLVSWIHDSDVRGAAQEAPSHPCQTEPFIPLSGIEGGLSR